MEGDITVFVDGFWPSKTPVHRAVPSEVKKSYLYHSKGFETNECFLNCVAVGPQRDSVSRGTGASPVCYPT